MHGILLSCSQLSSTSHTLASVCNWSLKALLSSANKSKLFVLRIVCLTFAVAIRCIQSLQAAQPHQFRGVIGVIMYEARTHRLYVHGDAPNRLKNSVSYPNTCNNDKAETDA